LLVIRRRFVSGITVLVVLSGTAWAQPELTLSATVVAPGQSVTVTVTGAPGHYYAVIGSSVNAGFSYAGVPLAVGADVTILSMSQLDGSGQAVVAITPPFSGTTLDRYYVQAVTSTSPTFVPLQASAGAIVRNRDSGLPEAFSGLPLNLPAGSYLLTGRTYAINASGAEYLVTCSFATTATGGSGFSAASFQHVPSGKRASLPLVALMAFDEAATVTVNCGTLPAGVAVFHAVAAVKVAAIH
jgi:hypothetical protein